METWKGPGDRVTKGRKKLHNYDSHFSEPFFLITSIPVIDSRLLDSSNQPTVHLFYYLYFFRVKMVFQGSKVTWVSKVTE